MNQRQNDLNNAIHILRNAELDGREGLPEELFLAISGLIPIANIDLLIINERKQLLLSRRNDAFFEQSWHIPGGCMRYGESFEQRLQKTALRELGTEVEFLSEPLAVRNVLRGKKASLKHPDERGHNIAILYQCRLPENFQIDNGTKKEDDDGYLKWFDELPSDFMQIQMVYSKELSPWIHKEEI